MAQSKTKIELSSSEAMLFLSPWLGSLDVMAVLALLLKHTCFRPR